MKERVKDVLSLAASVCGREDLAAYLAGGKGEDAGALGAEAALLLRCYNLTEYELASDYLVMAADLMMIKSRLLLPVPVSDEDDEEEDPTARILREVAEYEKIQVAAQLLSALPTMGDGFWRGFVAIEEEEAPEPEVLPQELARVWLAVVKNADLKINHTVSRQELSIHEFMSAIIRRVEQDRFVSFDDLVQNHDTMQERVVSFLAILELSREGLISITQAAPYAPIYCSKKFLELSADSAS